VIVGPSPACTAGPLLEVRHLQTHFFTDAGVVKAVEDVSFTLDSGETLAVVGESGSGKSVTSLSIMGLIPNPPGRIVGGEILFRTREGTTIDLAKPREAADICPPPTAVCMASPTWENNAVTLSSERA